MLITKDINKATDILISGGVVVIRTDTIYGIVASAKNQNAVERIFEIKGRRPEKPLIVLIDNIKQMFEPISDENLNKKLHDMWPGPYSVILNAEFSPIWLTRKSGTLAYRIPDNEKLRSIISKVGPLVAPSANPEGFEPASTIDEAVNYFGDNVEAYIDGGEVKDVKPSSLVQINHDGTLKKLR